LNKKLIYLFVRLGFRNSPIATNNGNLAQDIILNQRNISTQKKEGRGSSETPGGKVRSTTYNKNLITSFISASMYFESYTLTNFSGVMKEK
jgi:hypothetical protein